MNNGHCKPSWQDIQALSQQVAQQRQRISENEAQIERLSGSASPAHADEPTQSALAHIPAHARGLVVVIRLD